MVWNVPKQPYNKTVGYRPVWWDNPDFMYISLNNNHKDSSSYSIFKITLKTTD